MTMTLLDDIEALGIVPDEAESDGSEPSLWSMRLVRHREEKGLTQFHRLNALRRTIPPARGTHTARVLAGLRSGTKGAAILAKLIFGKPKNRAMELRNIRNVSSILTRLQRRGYVVRVGLARWQLAPKTLRPDRLEEP